MAKLLVKNKETGEIRPMTKSSFDLAGHKRGFVVVGTHEEGKPADASQSPSDIVKAEMARLKAEQSAKSEPKAAEKEPEAVESSEPEKPKRGRKPKESAE